MRMQTDLCGLVARDTLLLVAKAGDRPSKAQNVGSQYRLHRLACDSDA